MSVIYSTTVSVVTTATTSKTATLATRINTTTADPLIDDLKFQQQQSYYPNVMADTQLRYGPDKTQLTKPFDIEVSATQ